MSDEKYQRWKESIENVTPAPKNFEQIANDLCKKALDDAKSQLHPLVRDDELDRLENHYEFVQAFKLALERRIARRLAVWQPGVQAVFKFDESWVKNPKQWDSSVHLLIKVPRLSNQIKALEKKLDQSLVKYLKQLGWSRFRKSQTILDVQQVTPDEVRHGISYGAMFYAVYSVPVKVWPLNRPAK